MIEVILLCVYLVLLFALMLSRYRAIGKRGTIKPRDRQVIRDRLNKFVKYYLFTKMEYFKPAGLDVWFKCSSVGELEEIETTLRRRLNSKEEYEKKQ